MKYKDGRFGRHPRWRFLIFNMIMREEVRKTARVFVSRNSDLKDLDIDELKELLETDEMSELVWRGFLAHASKSTRRRPIWTEYFSFLLSQISSNLKKLVYFCGNGNAESVNQGVGASNPCKRSVVHRLNRLTKTDQEFLRICSGNHFPVREWAKHKETSWMLAGLNPHFTKWIRTGSDPTKRTRITHYMTNVSGIGVTLLAGIHHSQRVDTERMESVEQFLATGAARRYMEELMRANPTIAPEDASASGLIAHLKNEFGYKDFLQVFKYLKNFLDWEKTPKEGKAYCRSLFLNIAIQAKKQIHKDTAAKGRGDEASPTEPQLQKAILYNSLVNRRGTKDSYFEIDRAVELLNGLIKQLRADRHTSSIHEKLLLGRYTQLIKFYERQQEKFREALTRVANPYRGRKPLDDQLSLQEEHDERRLETLATGGGRGTTFGNYKAKFELVVIKRDI
ncbi:hypothetical protein V8E54_010188 [Elaphomyces granulatus]